MTKLSVNINKIATIRNARGGDNPCLLNVAKDCELFGADGITVHPRPDERHIKYEDVIELSKILNKSFNIEGFPSTKFIDLVVNVSPSQVTLVPDSPEQLTSNAGWNINREKSFLKEVIEYLHKRNIIVSLFIDANEQSVIEAVDTGADRVELYTEPYAKNFNRNPESSIAPYIKASSLAIQYGLEVNAGHDLSLANLHYYHKHIPFTYEVSIGHALICDALYLGLNNTIKKYLNCLI